jgi:hypothetical protein
MIYTSLLILNWLIVFDIKLALFHYVIHDKIKEEMINSFELHSYQTIVKGEIIITFPSNYC